MNAPLFFGSAGDERGTPWPLFTGLDKEFHFTLDAAASPHNHKCDLYFGEGGLATDALAEDWGGDGTTVFCNPPYSKADKFVIKAREEAAKGAVVVLLLAVRSDTRWWHNHIWSPGQLTFRPGVQCRFLPGRIGFELHVPDVLREWIVSEMLPFADAKPTEKKAQREVLSEMTGLPRMAIERIESGIPDAKLLDSAPFPSCVVVCTGVAA